MDAFSVEVILAPYLSTTSKSTLVRSLGSAVRSLVVLKPHGLWFDLEQANIRLLDDAGYNINMLMRG